MVTSATPSSLPSGRPRTPGGDDGPSPSRLVLSSLRPGGRAGAALVVAIAAATVLPLLAPQFTKRFVDGAIAGDSAAALVLLALGYLGLAVTGQLARMLTAWLASRLAWDGTNRLRELLAEHALGLDMAYHGKRTPGEMIERVDGDVVALAQFVVAFLLDVVVSLLLLLGVIVIVLSVDLRIGGVLLAFCGLLALGMVRAQRLAVPAATKVREGFAALFGNLEERLAGAEDIRANGAGEHMVNRFHQTSARLYRADVHAQKISGGLFAGTTVAFALGTALVLGLAAWSQQEGVLTVGTAVLLFQYTQMVRAPFERLIDQLQQYQKALAAVARIGGLLAERRTLSEPADPRPLPQAGPLSVDLDGVAFAYPDDDEQVLAGVDLHLAPGETLGLVGRTGSGKTTIARMVLRLYDPTEGSVRVGGVDLRDVALDDVHRRVCIVTQDVQLFAATVRDNLTLFRSESDAGLDDERLSSVLGQVGLGGWLESLPDGLDTVLGPQGGGVSAGEAQLLAFARAFLTDAGVVVLDEASSRLDPATEARIEAAMDRLLADRTGILIAHRLSSLARVDQIAVVDEGRVVEYGRRDELAADPASWFGHLLDAAGVRR
ncbi:ABC transporter ATP-binding protein [Phytoactinopolyspora halotolerans]|uniref:ABC transporter ATP-binding protein n=1 Tax=Phytoactinopolyspora halotolerans TaxID=1981512 RepID=A0A6L9S2T8_9ACTN|nr:ABC transporter ATP-binding protein [Phytoactinopolyspora halotolerans]NED99515.1 ABC transporter ATP-binding protein [Phytoactinopolyspora halotolerans]